MKDDHFIARWSRRKHAAAREVPVETQRPEALAGAAPAVPAPATESPPVAAPLPELESLSSESDFSPFMRPEVDEILKRRALKTLFQDPRFNVMDGLDVYIDDYSKPDPLPEGWLEKLNQVARLGDYKPPEVVPENPHPETPTDDVAEAGSNPKAASASESPPPDIQATNADPPEVPES